MAGFGDNTLNLFLLGNNNPGFATYDLKSSIGPLSGTTLINAGSAFGTTSGAFVISSVRSASFQATLQSVPEPSSLALCGVGLAGAIGFVVRRRSEVATA